MMSTILNLSIQYVLDEMLYFTTAFYLKPLVLVDSGRIDIHFFVHKI